MNPELVICNLDSKVKLNMELTIEKGRGYVPAEENKKQNALAALADSAFSAL